jgi:hypothetical protein
MKTNHMRHLLPLAAIALIASGCDPFPAAPTQAPQVVRVISTDETWTFHSVTVENPGTSAGTVSLSDAYPLDQIYVQFNKPMNGLTLQKYADYDANGNKVDPTSVPEGTLCARPANLTATGFGAATEFCYYPGSVTDGGQMVITPDAEMVIGTTYKVTGTVQDYEGKSLPIDITVTVDPLPTATAVDGLAHPGYGVTYAYGLMVDWFPTGAASYSLQTSIDNGSTWSPTISVPNTACVPARDFNTASGTPIGYTVCESFLPELPTDTDYLFRVGDGAAPTSWREASGTTRAPLGVTLTNFAAAGSSTLVAGAVQLNWGRVLPAAQFVSSPSLVQPTWLVERAPDVSGAPGTFADITPFLTTTSGAARAVTSTSRIGVDLTANPPGTTYWYRVRPVYTSGTVRVGAPASKVSYIAP